VRSDAFLHTVTIQTMSVTYNGGRQSVPTWTESATGVSALISPISLRYRITVLGGITDERHLLFLPAGTTINRGDRVVDEGTNEVYTVATQPVTYKDPRNATDSHMQCEITPLDPEE